MGGVASWGRIVEHFPAAQVRTAVANGRVVKIGHGLYGLPQVERAVVAARSLNGVLSLTSAAMHHGFAVKTPPFRPHITVPRNRKVSPQRRRGVQLRYADVSTDGVATTPLQTVIDCARSLPFDEALSVADSALRSGKVGKGSLLAAAEQSPRTGRNAALRVAREADGRADNPFESVTRAISGRFRGSISCHRCTSPVSARPTSSTCSWGSWSSATPSSSTPTAQLLSRTSSATTPWSSRAWAFFASPGSIPCCARTTSATRCRSGWRVGLRQTDVQFERALSTLRLPERPSGATGRLA